MSECIHSNCKRQGKLVEHLPFKTDDKILYYCPDCDEWLVLQDGVYVVAEW